MTNVSLIDQYIRFHLLTGELNESEADFLLSILQRMWNTLKYNCANIYQNKLRFKKSYQKNNLVQFLPHMVYIFNNEK